MRLAVLLCCLTTVASHLAVAQTDPPSRVARLSYMEGQVSFQPGSVEEWVPAEINRPMTTGDGLWADDGSRAEVHIGTARLRLSRQTGVSFLNLDENTVQVQLDRGTLRIDVQEVGDGETFEVDTPNVAFALQRAGEYRFEVNEQGDLTRITVRAGEGEASGGGQTMVVSAPRQARFSGTDSVTYELGAPAPPDDFDRWCAAREMRAQRAESAKYVPREMAGYEDLDDHGTWRSDPEYGPMWSPRGVSANWAPYRDGRWVWVEPWGWTWVDDAPWGFAPFHYGRWVFASRRWGWVPGPMVRRPVYAPALVVWVGGSSFGTGVAWFPLGPREAYVPVYRTSPAYRNRLNVNIINVTRVNYANRTYVTVVSREAFVNARPVAHSMVHVPPDAIARARFTNTVRIAPQRVSVLGHGAVSVRVAHPPVALVSRPVVVRTAPPPRRVPFSQQERLLAKAPGRPLGPAELSRVRPAGATHPNVRLASSSSSGRESPSARRPSRQPGEIGATPPDSGRSRSTANTKAAERRLRQEQQQRQRQQQQEQRKQQELQRKEQKRPPQARPSRQQRTYPSQQQQTQPSQTQRARPSRQQQQTQPSQTEQTQPSRKQRQKKSAPPKKEPEPPKNQ